MLLTCQARGRVVFVIGSAATASHFACDLSKGTRRDGPPTFHVVSLTDNVPLLTAWANDSGYDRVFSEQLTALARPGDLLVAISASGNSPNVVAAVDAARSCGMSVVGLSGRSGGRLAHLVDVLVNVPSDHDRSRGGRTSRRRPQSVRRRARAARLGRDPCSHNQSLRPAGATRRPLRMTRGRHLTTEQREPIGGTLPRRWRVHSRCDNTSSSGMEDETSDGELPPGSGGMTASSDSRSSFQECPSPPMTPAPRASPQGMQVITTDGHQLGRAGDSLRTGGNRMASERCSSRWTAPIHLGRRARILDRRAQPAFFGRFLFRSE